MTEENASGMSKLHTWLILGYHWCPSFYIGTIILVWWLLSLWCHPSHPTARQCHRGTLWWAPAVPQSRCWAYNWYGWLVGCKSGILHHFAHIWHSQNNTRYPTSRKIAQDYLPFKAQWLHQSVHLVVEVSPGAYKGTDYKPTSLRPFNYSKVLTRMAILQQPCKQHSILKTS